MSFIKKHLGVITDNKFAATREEWKDFPDLIIEGGYEPDKVLGSVYLCWFKELVECHSFPGDYRIPAARVLTEIVESLLDPEIVQEVPVCYAKAIQKGFNQDLYSVEVLGHLESNQDRYCTIIENVVARIKAAELFS